MDDSLVVYSDGGSRGNPGPAAIGFVIKSPAGVKLFEVGRFIGFSTNNAAEYQALMQALRKAKELKAKRVRCFLDSELVVRQLNGGYRVKNTELKKLFLNLVNLLGSFEKVSFSYVPRQKNSLADGLVNKALDRFELRRGD